MVAFVDAHRAEYGVAQICAGLLAVLSVSVSAFPAPLTSE